MESDVSLRMDDAVTVERERRAALDPRDGDKYSRESHFRFNKINHADNLTRLRLQAVACTPAKAVPMCMISGKFAMTHFAAPSAQNPSIRSDHQCRNSARWNEKCRSSGVTYSNIS